MYGNNNFDDSAIRRKPLFRVKICGITRMEDALAAESLGAAAVGFVFYPSSRRFIEPVAARAISDTLGPFIARVGVFVDDKPANIRLIREQAGLTAVQLHGSETPESVRALAGIPVIKAFRVGEEFSPDRIGDYRAHAYLLDTYVPGECYGGTGKTFDWDIARTCRRHGKIILAGGITAENVADAIKAADPWGIDVSSGVECSPGVKDSEKMAALFDTVTGELTE